MADKNRVIVVPCSGIGKPFGSVARLAAFIVTEDERPLDSKIVPLALIVQGESDLQEELSSHPSITLDGCKLACAAKVVRENGGNPEKEFAVLEVFRRYRDFKPEGIAELNEGGQKLAAALADEVVEVIDSIKQRSENNA